VLAHTRLACAKVNLALSVGPPEPPGSAKPGWHLISTWMHAIDLADDLRIERAPASSTYSIAWSPDAPRPSPIDWPTDADLAVRAHRLLEAHAGRTLPIHLQLNKRIPVGGGLGGGSSDAAATLMAVNTLFALGLSPADLRTLSQRLGSDVAFFIDDDASPLPPRPAIVSGFGDRIDRLESRRADPLVLFAPPFPCPTPAVYRAYDAAPRPLRDAQVRMLTVSPGAPTGHFNDLDSAAALVAPPLGPLRARLAAALNRPIHMTGSGSTLFALASSDDEAHSLAAKARTVPGITVIPTRCQ
jgi:4-diphosphocytidyl-2-C-methyl-D-erythritol kinase